LIAVPAVHRRVNGNSLTGFYPGYFSPRLLDDAGCLVPDDKGKLNDLGTDSAGGVIVNVRTANTHGFYPDEHIRVPGNFGFRHLSDFELSGSGEQCGFHDSTISQLQTFDHQFPQAENVAINGGLILTTDEHR